MLKFKKIFCCAALANSLVAESVFVTRAQCFTSFIANLVSKKNENVKSSSCLKTGFLSSIAKKFFSKKNEGDHLAVIPKISFLGLTVKSILEKKHQWFDGPCWAFAVTASLETALAKNGKLKNSFSEKHLLNWANRKNNEYGWHINIMDGANFEVAKGYLMSGAGPIYEKNKKYTFDDEYFSSEDEKLKPVCSVRGIKEINSDIESLKNAIDEYGAVFAKYEIKRTGNKHAISLTGWNDEKKVWLVKDSLDSSENYYKELPYNTKFSGCSAFCDVRKYNENEKIYQHDFYGINDLYTFRDEPSITVCNVYDFKENETLKEVCIATHAKDCKYEVYYTDIFEDEKPSNNENNWQKLKTGTVPYNGYLTLDLDKKVKLKKGKGALIVRLKKAKNKESLPCIYTAKNTKKLKIKEEKGNCYVLKNNTFFDVQELNEKKEQEGLGIFSIKAITE